MGLVSSLCDPPFEKFLATPLVYIVTVVLYIGTIGLPRLAWALLTLIGSCRIYYVFKIKAGKFRKRYRSCNRFAKEKSLTITNIL